MTSPDIQVVPEPTVRGFASTDSLVSAVAREILDVLTARGPVGQRHLVVTGGRAGTAVIAELGRLAPQATIPWHSTHIWWSDERLLPRNHSDRNDFQALAAWPGFAPIPPCNVHVMPALVGSAPPDGSADMASDAYAAELRQHSPEGEDTPFFDVVLLSVGEDGHVASLFPGPDLHDPATVLPVYDAPKPPPVRLTLGLLTLRSAARVWVMATGASKAPAVNRWQDIRHDSEASMSAERLEDFPAAAVYGQQETVWWCDAGALEGKT